MGIDRIRKSSNMPVVRSSIGSALQRCFFCKIWKMYRPSICAADKRECVPFWRTIRMSFAVSAITTSFNWALRYYRQCDELCAAATISGFMRKGHCLGLSARVGGAALMPRPGLRQTSAAIQIFAAFRVGNDAAGRFVHLSAKRTCHLPCGM